jgi:hypothetical protein
MNRRKPNWPAIISMSVAALVLLFIVGPQVYIAYLTNRVHVVPLERCQSPVTQQQNCSLPSSPKTPTPTPGTPIP